MRLVLRRIITFLTIRLIMDMVDPDASAESAVQALQWCVNMGHQDILQALLKTHFTHRKLSDMAEQCAEVLVRVVQAGSCDLLQQLLPYVDESFLWEIGQSKDKNHVTKLLCIAVEKGSDEMVEILTQRGGDVDSFYHGKPLLHLSLTLGHVSIARKLVSAGANVAAIDKRGESVLIPAICSSIEEKDEVIYWLLQQGIDARHKGSSGKEPIHIAAAHSGSAIKQLVNTGCDVNVQDEVNGDTPLHIACGLCCPETVKTLNPIWCKN
ncbi:hypothetical protein KUTeg_001187 [Tegillarca granosa]|uniref:Uncharacterized protein n=1 Tax=Tegillarca granosa TaxID=220873 RepID=A0ABQ9FVV1_TEGGR|nr:hypothetical protein KUTeg_001187 [Tegillarca granosa]